MYTKDKEKDTKKILLKLTACILAALLLFGCMYLAAFFARGNGPAPLDENSVLESATNFVLMIGDGMGFAHIDAADAFKRRETGEGLFLTEGKETSDGEVTTRSKALFLPTDSAAAATAMSTGFKTHNGKIARSGGKNLQTLTEYTASLGKATGIIATETLAGATPAAFSSHADNRGDKEKIITEQINSDITLFLGEGQDDYLPYSEEIKSNGYTFVSDEAQLDAGKNAQKIFATLNIGASDDISLAQSCLFALDFLSKNKEGFFLMAEGSHIDKRSHANDFLGMIEQLIEFDDAVRAVYENLPTDTILIVTADHETGSLRFLPNQDLSQAKFRSKLHSAVNVPYFAFNLNLPKTIDNTHIRQAAELFLKN